MTREGDEESDKPLAEERLGREVLHVKLDRGFDEGTYSVYVHFSELASRIGFEPARIRAEQYCGLLKAQIDRFAGHSVGETKYADGIRVSRKREQTDVMYVNFPVVLSDGRFRDAAMKKEFHLAVLRAVQQWEQEKSRVDTQKQDGRRDAFRLQLGELLAGDAYQHLDKVTKDRLLVEVPALAFPPRGHEL